MSRRDLGATHGLLPAHNSSPNPKHDPDPNPNPDTATSGFHEPPWCCLVRTHPQQAVLEEEELREALEGDLGDQAGEELAVAFEEDDVGEGRDHGCGRGEGVS